MSIRLKQFTQTYNVGDVIGARIVKAITGREVRIVGEAPQPAPNLIGIGSIAHWADEFSVLWGCGLVAEHLGIHPPARVLALRGELTRDILTRRGIRCSDVLGDVGLLLPDLIAPSPPEHAVGLVPHYVDRDGDFVASCRSMGIPIVDVFAAPEVYVAQLTACRRILSSSLHGLILAHAYGIEAAWVKISDRVHGEGFKFYDYYSSLGVGRHDVSMLLPGDSWDRMLESCWKPDQLPDRARLRQALVERVSELDT